jgi:valyl-tRNA synthetase
MAAITKSYEAHDVEKKWYAAWLEADAFAGRVRPGKKPYTIMIPPPNVTGGADDGPCAEQHLAGYFDPPRPT